jgi:hypothetical protein
MTPIFTVVSGDHLGGVTRGADRGWRRVLPARDAHVRTAMVDLVQMDAAQSLRAQDGEHQEHGRQDTRELSPTIGEQRANSACQVHGEPNSNGTDTVPGNPCVVMHGATTTSPSPLASATPGGYCH